MFAIKMIISIISVSVFVILLIMHVRLCITPNYRIVLIYVKALLGNRYAVEEYTFFGWEVIRYENTLEDAKTSLEKLIHTKNTKREILYKYLNGNIE